MEVKRQCFIVHSKDVEYDAEKKTGKKTVRAHTEFFVAAVGKQLNQDFLPPEMMRGGVLQGSPLPFPTEDLMVRKCMSFEGQGSQCKCCTNFLKAVRRCFGGMGLRALMAETRRTEHCRGNRNCRGGSGAISFKLPWRSCPSMRRSSPRRVKRTTMTTTTSRST